MAQILSTVAGDQSAESYKTPPHSVEAEQSVLGGLMLDNQSWDKVADIINEDDFYRLDHRLIYRHICKLIEHNKPADVVTVAESLETSADLQNAGGLTYVGTMAQNTPSAAKSTGRSLTCASKKKPSSVSSTTRVPVELIKPMLRSALNIYMGLNGFLPLVN